MDVLGSPHRTGPPPILITTIRQMRAGILNHIHEFNKTHFYERFGQVGFIPRRRVIRKGSADRVMISKCLSQSLTAVAQVREGGGGAGSIYSG